jgi:hypothetical protein
MGIRGDRARAFPDLARAAGCSRENVSSPLASTRMPAASGKHSRSSHAHCNPALNPATDGVLRRRIGPSSGSAPTRAS